MNSKALFYNIALSPQLPCCLAGLSLLAIVNWELQFFHEKSFESLQYLDIDLRRMYGGGRFVTSYVEKGK